ncbi:MAG: ankyrin repeat domain-containing protein [Bacteroidota bacterium]
MKTKDAMSSKLTYFSGLFSITVTMLLSCNKSHTTAMAEDGHACLDQGQRSSTILASMSSTKGEEAEENQSVPSNIIVLTPPNTDTFTTLPAPSEAKICAASGHVAMALQQQETVHDASDIQMQQAYNSGTKERQKALKTVWHENWPYITCKQQLDRIYQLEAQPKVINKEYNLKTATDLYTQHSSTENIRQTAFGIYPHIAWAPLGVGICLVGGCLIRKVNCSLRASERKLESARANAQIAERQYMQAQKTIDLILQYNANATAQDGSTLLHWAAINGHIAVATLLLNRNAQIAARDQWGLTPLHWATYQGHTAMAAMFLDRNAQIEARTNTGYTPLHWAAQEGHAETVQLLLNRSADATAKNDDGQTPLELADQERHANVVALLRNN